MVSLVLRFIVKPIMWRVYTIFLLLLISTIKRPRGPQNINDGIIIIATKNSRWRVMRFLSFCHLNEITLPEREFNLTKCFQFLLRRMEFGNSFPRNHCLQKYVLWITRKIIIRFSILHLTAHVYSRRLCIFRIIEINCSHKEVIVNFGEVGSRRFWFELMNFYT